MRLRYLLLVMIFCLPALADKQKKDFDVQQKLEEDVRMLCETIGERNPYKYEKLQQAMKYIDKEVPENFVRKHQTYTIKNKSYTNLAFEKKGSKKIIVIGAHYDSAMGTPGADDNASGVAVLIALSHMLKNYENKYTLRFVAFTLEEPPYFASNNMGSARYAALMAKQKEQVQAMICLEMLGFYSEEHIQKYPDPALKNLYPAHANYVAVVSKFSDSMITSKFYKLLKSNNSLSTQLLIAPPHLTGVDFSDHRSFWEYNYPAFMITDTSFYRNDHYHKATDVAETLDYKKMAILTSALAKTIRTFDQDKTTKK
ncbi:M28 family peptidase [Candidatus Uabimicrobium sp. HlEnr_7]|uniref:M28 family peptidase n=1 Tax=Candidatus Uabimicrobium helgolandensis TaxID=3095367 RepID=UPI0035569287